ncbi:alkaline phosphatase family protein [Streptacidiphilus neutrinimicus]|uniref:alkaline phosphatase family protein n=1 Tax=Streptacidiphilus neutrinimicus TaxID=105420 RepID=UPI0007C6F848
MSRVATTVKKRLGRLSLALLGGAALAATGMTAAVAPAHAANSVPKYDHVVVVMEENHAYDEVIGDTADAPYINNTLASGGALFTQSFAVEHPSQPNYLDLFSGSNQGVTDDSCPHTFSADNEGAQLLAAGDTFAGYSEDLPSTGSTSCTSGSYARKHVPWSDFSNIPAADNRPFTSFPSDFTQLPTVSWVIPNLNDDMHDGTIAEGDTWLQNNVDAYAQWAKTHNSLLVVTWDEDDSSMSNQIPTIFYGAGVKAGQYSETVNHYNVLRTIEDMYGLPYAGAAASATPITDVWGGSAAETVSVTNPGGQTGTVGTAASLQVAATDSAGNALTYSAVGLPAGLSMSPSGLISGTPTTAGTSNVTVTASSGTASGSASFTWTVNPSGGGGCTAAQLLGNPGFETGAASPWRASSGVISNDSSEPARSGSWDAWLDGYGSTHTDTLSQSVAVPAGCSAENFSFWLHVDTAETTKTTAYDTLKVQVLNGSGTVLGTLATYSNLNANTGYTQHSFSLAGYAGQTVTLKFTGSENAGNQTSFVIDDTALAVS